MTIHHWLLIICVLFVYVAWLGDSNRIKKSEWYHCFGGGVILFFFIECIAWAAIFIFEIEI